MSEINQKDLISEILLFCRSNLVQLEGLVYLTREYITRHHTSNQNYRISNRVELSYSCQPIRHQSQWKKGWTYHEHRQSKKIDGSPKSFLRFGGRSKHNRYSRESNREQDYYCHDWSYHQQVWHCDTYCKGNS